jgi:hypothetical protein
VTKQRVQGPIFPDFMDKFNDLHGLDNGYLNLQNGNGGLWTKSGQVDSKTSPLCLVRWLKKVEKVTWKLLRSYNRLDCKELGMYILSFQVLSFVGLAYQGEDIAFRFIIEYSSLRDFGP